MKYKIKLVFLFYLGLFLLPPSWGQAVDSRLRSNLEPETYPSDRQLGLLYNELTANLESQRFIENLERFWQQLILGRLAETLIESRRLIFFREIFAPFLRSENPLQLALKSIRIGLPFIYGNEAELKFKLILADNYYILGSMYFVRAGELEAWLLDFTELDFNNKVNAAEEPLYNPRIEHRYNYNMEELFARKDLRVLDEQP